MLDEIIEFKEYSCFTVKENGKDNLKDGDDNDDKMENIKFQTNENSTGNFLSNFFKNNFFCCLCHYFKIIFVRK